MVCTTNCTPCLVGQEWDALRKENGLAGILRDTVVTLDMNNWLSAYVQISLMRILIGEMLGYEVKFAWNIDANEIERLASGEVTMNPEIWSSDTNKRGDFERSARPRF